MNSVRTQAAYHRFSIIMRPPTELMQWVKMLVAYFPTLLNQE